jgi:hypothetical protein
MTTPAQPPSSSSASVSAPASTGAVSELIRRLEALEGENSRLRRQGIITLVITAVLVGLAASIIVTAARHGMPGLVPAVVEAREFVLRDRDGQVRGAWGQDDQGAIRLVLQDHLNKTSIKLNLLEDGSSGLTFSDSTGNSRLIMAVLPDETANLVFADRSGIARTVLGLSAKGGSTLLFADGGGVTRSGIGVDNRGRSMFTTSGAAETPGSEDSVAVQEAAPPKRTAKPAKKPSRP